MLSVVISTLGEGIRHLDKTVSFQHPAVCYLIVHQTASASAVPEYLKHRRDIEVIQSNTRGLAISRNIGLQHCQTRYALIADDDVEFLSSGMEELLYIIENERPDFALFRIQTPEGQPDYKVYPSNPYKVTCLKHWISSIEIVVNVHGLKRGGIHFDERFGLGTALDRGEEEIFVLDLIRAGWEGYYYPVPIVQHPYESSGKKNRCEKDRYFFQGAFDTRTGNKTHVRFSLADYVRSPKRILSSLFYRRGVNYINRTKWYKE